MISIRKKLLHSILTVVLAVTFLLALITYFSVRGEIDEFYDKNLKEAAHTIIEIDYTNPPSVESKNKDLKLKGEEKYLTQVWDKSTLKYSSYPNIHFPLQAKGNEGTTKFEGDKWYYIKETKGPLTIQLSQNLEERHSVILEIYGYLIIPILIQFPILAGLIWIIISYSLKPLLDISSRIKNRNSSFLAPLSNDGVPIEINPLVEEINGLLERLNTALEIQRHFTADAAHELRTPLTAIRLQLDLLKRADNKTETETAITALESGILRSTRLVQQLLELARQDPNESELQHTQVDFSRIVKESYDIFFPIASAETIALNLNIQDNILIRGDAVKLAVMIGNLINNAIIYSNKNGDVHIHLAKNGNSVTLEIADNGIGIAPSDRERVFDRFYRSPGTGKTGSGLGLSIVKNIVEAHNATIAISDGIGNSGTKFTVIFPAI